MLGVQRIREWMHFEPGEASLARHLYEIVTGADGVLGCDGDVECGVSTWQGRFGGYMILHPLWWLPSKVVLVVACFRGGTITNLCGGI